MKYDERLFWKKRYIYINYSCSFKQLNQYWRFINFKIFCGINFCNWSGLKTIPKKIYLNKSQHRKKNFCKFFFRKTFLSLYLVHIPKVRTYNEHIDLRWFKNMRPDTNASVSVGKNVIFSLNLLTYYVDDLSEFLKLILTIITYVMIIGSFCSFTI